MNQRVLYDAGGRLWEDALRLPNAHFDARGRRRAVPLARPPPHREPPRVPHARPPPFPPPEVATLATELRSVEKENALLRRHVHILTLVYQRG